MFRTQCFTFVGDSLPQIYVSLTYDMPTMSVCEMLNLCDATNPFANERLIEEQLKKIENIGTNFEKFEKRLPPPFPGDLLVTPPQTTPSPFEETRQPYIHPKPPAKPQTPVDPVPYPPQPIITSTPSSTSTTTLDPIDFSGTGKIPDFKELASKSKAGTGKGTKSEIAAFANATCSRLVEPDLAEQCFQLTDRKINELAIFVDEQVVEALWCAQLNGC